MGNSRKRQQQVVTNPANLPSPAPQPQEQQQPQENAAPAPQPQDNAVQTPPPQQQDHQLSVEEQHRIGDDANYHRMTPEEANAFWQQCQQNGVKIPIQTAPAPQPQAAPPTMSARPTFPQVTIFQHMPDGSVIERPMVPSDYMPRPNPMQMYQQQMQMQQMMAAMMVKNQAQQKQPKKMTKKEEDEFFSDSVFWNPGSEWETIGYIAGGAALVGLGALIYHFCRKD